MDQNFCTPGGAASYPQVGRVCPIVRARPPARLAVDRASGIAAYPSHRPASRPRTTGNCAPIHPQLDASR
jgi:hypothetical protein